MDPDLPSWRSAAFLVAVTMIPFHEKTARFAGTWRRATLLDMARGTVVLVLGWLGLLAAGMVFFERPGVETGWGYELIVPGALLALVAVTSIGWYRHRDREAVHDLTTRIVGGVMLSAVAGSVGSTIAYSLRELTFAIVVLIVASLLVIFLGPTRSRLRREQERLRLRGSSIDLVHAMLQPARSADHQS
ncbi:MAG: hypothetical protein WD096_06010 [Actinomycetota bacterium]